MRRLGARRRCDRVRERAAGPARAASHGRAAAGGTGAYADVDMGGSDMGVAAGGEAGAFAGGTAEGRSVGRGALSIVAVAAALAAVAALPGVATAEVGAPNPYAFDNDAQTVPGGASQGAAQEIALGSSYKSTIGPEGGSPGTVYYRLELDATSDVYVSVTAVPRLATKVHYEDGLDVSIQDADGTACSQDHQQFGSAESPRPVTALVTRTIDSRSATCQRPGAYYLVVERVGAPDSTPDDWGLELGSATEPRLTQAPSTTPPSVENPAVPPSPPADQQGERPGGTSFSTAASLQAGIWEDGIKPGETHYYRVPVDWGQQVFLRAELSGPRRQQGAGGTAAAGGASGGQGSVGADILGSALVMSLYNPVRGAVDSTDMPYDGMRTGTGFRPPPPVAYENRYGADPKVSAMRFAGWYYLSVSLNPRLAGQFGDGAYGVSLSVAVYGAAQQGPDYAGTSKPAGMFHITARDRLTATSGESPDEADDEGNSMRLLGVAALATGTALLLVLGSWTVLARRHARVAAAGVPAAGGGAQDAGPGA